MTSPEAPPPRSRSSRSLRGLAAVAALVVGAALFGFATSPANAQTNPQNSGALDTNAIAEKVDPAVVNINTTLAGGGEAAGTGMVITSSGEVLTNNHVIENATSVRVTIGGSGRSRSAKVLGYNVSEDIALLKVDGVSGLKTVATDTSVAVGESVVALGNALGRGGEPEATSGSVTALGQTITVADTTGGGQTLRDLIRINASLQPGDSGGPLVDKDGEVVGVNTAASSGGRYRLESGSSTGYAVPIKTALSVAHQIESGEGSGDTHVGERAFLGVSVQDAGAGQRLPGDEGASSGVVVAGVQSGSPADDAGISEGDEIVSLAGKTINSLDDITSALAPHHPRDKVQVGWVDSSGDRHTATVTLASGPPA